jgi:hypothetical protein
MFPQIKQANKNMLDHIPMKIGCFKGTLILTQGRLVLLVGWREFYPNYPAYCTMVFPLSPNEIPPGFNNKTMRIHSNPTQ